MIVQINREQHCSIYCIVSVCRPGVRVAGGGGGGAGGQRAAPLRLRQADSAAAGVEVPGMLLHLRLQGVKVRVLSCYEA